MSTAKKAVHAAVGAGSEALTAAKGLPARAARLPQIVSEKAGSLAGGSTQIASLPAKAATIARKTPELALGAAEKVRTIAGEARTTAARRFESYAKRGEAILSTRNGANGGASETITVNGAKKPKTAKAKSRTGGDGATKSS
ncbi:MAG: hypothetical protein NVSMB57_01480 [Actinomycetota bacterium]